MWLRTLAIGAYIFVVVFTKTETQHFVHDRFPPVAYASTFFWFYDTSEWTNRSSVKLADADITNKEGIIDGELALFDLEEEKLTLFSPIYTFVWELQQWVETFELEYTHKDNEKKLSIDLSEYVNDMWVWTIDVGLHNDLMKSWKNTYAFVAKTLNGQKKTYKKILQVDFEEIVLGETTMYLDPYHVVDTKQIVRQEDDFEWIPASFLTLWCIDTNAQVLIEHEYSYDILPACLTYSLKKQYLVFFADKRETNDGLYYLASSPEHGTVYRNFPLYQWKFGSIYQSLMFFNPWWQFVQIVKALGDQNNYETLIQHFDIRSQSTTMSLRQINSDQVEIENGYEKVLLYYFKDNDSKRSLTYPWLRYKYYVKRGGSRRLINQWTVYHLDKIIRVEPEQEFGTAYRMDAWLHGDNVVVQDPFKHITYDIMSLARFANIEEKPAKEFSCKQATIGIYSYQWWVLDYVYENDNINILGRWRNVDNVQIQDNLGSTYEVEQHIQWYVAATIEPEEKWWAIWPTTFTITGYTQNGRELCKQEVTLEILEQPVY